MQARLCLERYDMRIRSATTQDAARLLAIYAYYVEKTAISFEREVPSLTEFTGRIAKTLLKYPYLVVEEDGVVEGYTYAGPFKERAAYDRSCELSIYLARDSKGRGYGRKLYEAMEAALKDMGIMNMYACIADPITEDELPMLEINVDVLGDAEDIDSKEQLDVKKYGVIVSTRDGRRGLLLPDLEGVDTVDYQVAIAMQKGGIRPNEKYSLQRFEVVRHV